MHHFLLKIPTYYGRILPVLLSLDPPSSVIKGVRVTAVHNALKNAFESCLKCTHSSAALWRDRLVGALKEIKSRVLIEQTRHHQDSKANGSAKEFKDGLPTIKEEPKAFCAVQSDSGKKRSDAEDRSNLADVRSSKRSKHTPNVSEESSKEFNRSTTASQDDGSSTSRRDVDNGLVQQLVSMFGVMVAQGEKVLGSLELLIASISADLLAEVMMATMRNLPPNCSQTEGDEPVESISIVGSDNQSKYPPSFLANVLSLSSTFPPVAALLSSETEKPQCEEFHASPVTDNTAVSMDMIHGAEDALPAIVLPSPDVVWSEVGLGSPSAIHDLDAVDGSIPGLHSSDCHNGLSESLPASLLVSPKLEDNTQNQVANFDGRALFDVVPSIPKKLEDNTQNQAANFDGRALLNVVPSISTKLEDNTQNQVALRDMILSKSTDRSAVPSISTDRSDELSTKTAIIDSNAAVSSTATSVGFPCPVVLPKMLAPFINLADEENDHLQKLAFIRIVEAYKQIAVSGGSQVRFSLLVSLGV